jgi:hypothetical protein
LFKRVHSFYPDKSIHLLVENPDGQPSSLALLIPEESPCPALKNVKRMDLEKGLDELPFLPKCEDVWLACLPIKGFFPERKEVFYPWVGIRLFG